MSGKPRKLPKGPLTAPLRPPDQPPDYPTALLTGTDPLAVEEWKDKYEEWRTNAGIEMGLAAIEKLGALLDHYGIQRDAEERWFNLALKLALDYVPGFQVERKPVPKGRRLKWTEMRLAALHCAVMTENLRRRDVGLAESDIDACRRLAKTDAWRGWGEAKTLCNKLGEARTSLLVQMIEGMRADPRIGLRAYEIFQSISLNK